MIRPAFLALSLAASTAISGCAYQTSANTYDPRAVGQVAYTDMGVVRASRPVEVVNDNPAGTGIGAAVGGFAGAVAGSQIGPSRRYGRYGRRHHDYSSAGSVLGTIGGAIAGAVVGAVIEREASRSMATEYVIQLDDGEVITIVQGDSPIPPGQRVFVQMPEYGRARIVPAA